MPVSKGKSAFMAKMGDKLRKAHEAHKGDETTYSEFGNLPEGIDGGIAQIVEVKFDQYKKGETKGEFFFYAAGTVHKPLEHNGMRTEGLRTVIMEPLCDTPTRTRKTVDDHVEWIYNELRKLGVDTSSMSFDDLEPACEALKEAAPFFRFRTWKGSKATEGKYKDQEPRVQHQWDGAVEYDPETGEGGGAVEDSSGEAPSESEAASSEAGGEIDVAALVEQANSGDGDAQQALTDAALAAGVSKEDVDTAANWEAVADYITQAGEGAVSSESEPEPEKPWEPKKGETCTYQPIDPKTKKPFIDPKTKKARKPVECTIEGSDKKSKTATLKNLDDGKTTYKGVKWDAITKVTS